MHDYLRAIGFSGLKKNKDVRDILNLVMLRPTSEYVSSREDAEAAFGERLRILQDAWASVSGANMTKTASFIWTIIFLIFVGKTVH